MVSSGAASRSGPRRAGGGPPVELAELLRDFGAGAAERFVDADAPVERGLRRLTATGAGGVGVVLGHLGEVVAAAGGDDADLAARLGLRPPVPAGGSWHAWCRYLQGWLPQAGATPAGDPAGDPGDDPPGDGERAGVLSWVSRFADAATADRATTEVLRAHEGALRAWAADPAGARRLFLRADLGRTLGVVLRRSPGPGGVAGTGPRAEAGGGAPARRCAVLLGRVGAGGSPAILAAYPEPDPAAAVAALLARGPYPDLPLLFGGHFGQDVDAIDGTCWGAERSFNQGTPLPTRQRVADQLGILLGEGDPRLLALVEGLGCAIPPAGLRRWVEGLRRRVLRLDWAPLDAGNPHGPAG